MDKLRRLGYPVDAVPGTAGGYRLGAGAALPPLLLDDEEAVAVAIGLRIAAGGSLSSCLCKQVVDLVVGSGVPPLWMMCRCSPRSSLDGTLGSPAC